MVILLGLIWRSMGSGRWLCCSVSGLRVTGTALVVLGTTEERWG